MVNANHKQKGFTLIELLVVISIIALLLSILLPSLNKARRQTRKLACGSNLRQLSLSIFLYSENNNGYLPPHADTGYLSLDTGYIQDDLMNELLKEAKTRVKKEAVILAIKSFLEAKRREKLAALIGNYEFGYSLEQLQEMRKDG